MTPHTLAFTLRIKRTLQQFGYDPYDSSSAAAIYWRCVKL